MPASPDVDDLAGVHATLRMGTGISLAALTWFVACAVAVHLRRPELDPVHSQMSLYLVGVWGPLLQAAYAVLAIGMIALAWSLRNAVVPALRSGAPLLLFVLGGLSLTITACAWMDLPGVDRSVEGLVHGISAQAAFLFATTGMLLQALRLRADPQWRAVARWALPWAALCFASIWLLALWRDAPPGLAQKAVIGLILTWLACVAVAARRRCPAGH